MLGPLVLVLTNFQSCGTGTANSSGAPAFTFGFSGIRVARSLILYILGLVDDCWSLCSCYVIIRPSPNLLSHIPSLVSSHS